MDPRQQVGAGHRRGRVHRLIAVRAGHHDDQHVARAVAMREAAGRQRLYFPDGRKILQHQALVVPAEDAAILVAQPLADPGLEAAPGLRRPAAEGRHRLVDTGDIRQILHRRGDGLRRQRLREVVDAAIVDPGRQHRVRGDVAGQRKPCGAARHAGAEPLAAAEQRVLAGHGRQSERQDAGILQPVGAVAEHLLRRQRDPAVVAQILPLHRRQWPAVAAGRGHLEQQRQRLRRAKAVEPDIEVTRIAQAGQQRRDRRLHFIDAIERHQMKELAGAGIGIRDDRDIIDADAFRLRQPGRVRIAEGGRVWRRRGRRQVVDDGVQHIGGVEIVAESIDGRDQPDPHRTVRRIVIGWRVAGDDGQLVVTGRWAQRCCGLGVLTVRHHPIQAVGPEQAKRVAAVELPGARIDHIDIRLEHGVVEQVRLRRAVHA